MPKILEKVERRLGEKLFLKADRCGGPKCAMVRRAGPPGSRGSGAGKERRRGRSEYGKLLAEKQKVRYLYGLDDRDVARYTKEAAEMSGVFSSNFLQLLESRLDNVVFRAGFAPSRRMARQLVNHGHILVEKILSAPFKKGGKTVVDIPSYRVSKGERVSVKESSLGSPIFAGIDARLKNYEPPEWIALDKNKKEAVVTGAPSVDEQDIAAEVTKIKEFYSR